MAPSGTARKAIGVALLLGGGAAIIFWEPWHGPTILSLSSGHGIDAGDLPALLLIALAVALARSMAQEALGEPRWPAHSWPGATCAIVVGTLLLLAGLDANAGGGPLVSAAGGTFSGATQHTSARRCQSCARLGVHRVDV